MTQKRQKAAALPTQPSASGVALVSLDQAATYADLVSVLHATDDHFARQAMRAVNVSLTMRNWYFGRHIAEFELRGADRAGYGERLLDELSAALAVRNVANTARRQLYQYLTFYRTYPTLVAPAQPALNDSDTLEIVPTASAQLAPPADTAIVRSLTAQFGSILDVRVTALSYTHFDLLLRLATDDQRRFYEAEAMAGQWSVRDLRRQISSLLYERTALSRNKTALRAQTAATLQDGMTAERGPMFAIRDPYVFEFLGIKPAEVMGESQLEDALLNKLQELLLELGRGFCFEARQRRILIDGEHFFVDLVFYHRILKCHVLVELKADEFRHEHIGQLNTYVNWYRKHEMHAGDQPPIGLLLCAGKNHALVEYALAGMDNQLFVSRYQVALPRKEELEQLVNRAMESLDQGSPT